jgi:predicted O-methyltransferase YrrM
MEQFITKTIFNLALRLSKLLQTNAGSRFLCNLTAKLVEELLANGTLRQTLAQIFHRLNVLESEKLIVLVNDVGQEMLDAFTSLPVPYDGDVEHHPFPTELRKFEHMYDSASGNWKVPFPAVKIKVFDKNLFPRLMADSVEVETGHFLYSFVKLVGSQVVLETGVSRGYSTSCIASALKHNASGGKVYAIDSFRYPHLWEGTDLEEFIVFIHRWSQESLPDVEGLEFDLLVIDSLHNYETCVWEVANFEKQLKPGGYILMHDSLHYDGVGAVVRQLQENPRFETITLPTPRGKLDAGPRRSGISIVRKIRCGEPAVQHELQYSGWEWGDTSEQSYLWRTDMT